MHLHQSLQNKSVWKLRTYGTNLNSILIVQKQAIRTFKILKMERFCKKLVSSTGNDDGF